MMVVINIYSPFAIFTAGAVKVSYCNKIMIWAMPNVYRGCMIFDIIVLLDLRMFYGRIQNNAYNS